MITPLGDQHPAELKGPWLQGRCTALTDRPTAQLHAAHGDDCPGPLLPAEPLLIEMQPPVGPAQQGRGERSVLNNYYVT